jgi:CRISPR-associated Cas5-like protein
MLEAIRITITAYTASFRVPHFVGHQLTLPVPPLSTIYGLISAAAGRWVLPQEVEWLAYRCEYESKAMDMEKIVQIDWENGSPFAQFRPPKICSNPKGISRNASAHPLSSARMGKPFPLPSLFASPWTDARCSDS